MDRVLHALSNEMRRNIVRELRRSRAGLRHSDLLGRLDLPKAKGGTLSTRLAELEDDGLVSRVDGRYRVVAAEPLGDLLAAAADVNVAAQRAIADRAQLGIIGAERLADALHAEQSEEPT
jgi:hypothetical protein